MQTQLWETITCIFFNPVFNVTVLQWKLYEIKNLIFQIRENTMFVMLQIVEHCVNMFNQNGDYRKKT